MKVLWQAVALGLAGSTVCTAGVVTDAALVSGVAADMFGLRAAVWLVAALTFASGLVVALRLRETRLAHDPGTCSDKDAAVGCEA